jgi:hypothetical protein
MKSVKQGTSEGVRSSLQTKVIRSTLEGDAPLMFGRREPVPFAFVAEADRFRSNVTPPPRERLSAGQMAGRWLMGLTIVAGLVGSLVIGTPALSPDHSAQQPQQSQASESR